MALAPGTGPGPWKGHYGSPNGAANIRDENGVMQRIAVRRLAGKNPNYRLEARGQRKNFSPRTEELPHNQPRLGPPYR